MNDTEKEVLQKSIADIMEKSLDAHLPGIVEAKAAAIMEKMLTEKKFPGHQVAEKTDGKKVFGGFLKKLYKKDFSGLIESKALSELSDSAGGFLVPEESTNEILRVVADFGIVRKLARIIPMRRDSLPFPVLGTGAVTTWPGQTNNGTDGSPVFKSVKMQVETAMCLVPMAKELLADADSALIDSIMELIGESMAGAEDEQALTGTGAPFTGIMAHPDVNVVVMGSGKTGFTSAVLNDYRDLITLVPINARKGGVYLMSSTVWADVQEKLQNSQNVVSFQNPIVTMKTEGGDLTPSGFLWGYPVFESEKMPSTTASAVSTKFAIFGNFKYFLFGDRQEIAMGISEEGSVGTFNAWSNNGAILRATERVALHVGVATAFSVLKTAAA